jgi:hypothetical protein
MKPESNRPITIEDLLRLKRAERPPTEFWETFDRKLRAKQLAALVGKRPWWQNLPRVFARVARYRVILGGAAVAAITIFSLRDHQAISPAQRLAIQPEPIVPVAESEAVPASHNAAVTPAPTGISSEALSSPRPVAVVATSEVPVQVAAPELPRVLPIGGPIAIDREPEVQSPSARRIAENLATVPAVDAVGARSLLAAASGFEGRAMPARVAVEPLQQMTPPSDSRRSRLLTAMVSMASLESSMRTTERAASRIAEDRLYEDQISRFGARGDRFQVKF